MGAQSVTVISNYPFSTNNKHKVETAKVYLAARKIIEYLVCLSNFLHLVIKKNMPTGRNQEIK